MSALQTLSSIFACTAVGVSIYTFVRITIASRRLDRARQRYDDAVAEMRAAALAAMQTVGAVPCEDVPTHEIKFGDEICWQSPDTKDHADYTAGYDGDPGPSHEGLHLREL